MPDPAPLSRRDWFRLRRPAAETAPPADTSSTPPPRPSAPTMGTRDRRLQAVTLPPNHDGMDFRELPPLREATLGRDDVRDLFTDIAHLASEVLLMQKLAGARTAHGGSAASPGQLAAVCQALLEGSVNRLQIRYRWQDVLWIDTLNREADTFRLIRIAHRGF